MKLAVISAVFASSVTTAATTAAESSSSVKNQLAGKSLHDVVFADHLPRSTNDKRDDIRAVWKEHRRRAASQNTENGSSSIVRRLQDKLLKRRSKLRNNLSSHAKKDGDNDTSDADANNNDNDIVDVGLFSRRNLQNETEAEPEEETNNGLEEVAASCLANNNYYTGEGYSCSCSNVDVDSNTATFVCTYDESCLDPVEDACGKNTSFCIAKTYELDIPPVGAATSRLCYYVNSPIEPFSYCYGRSLLDSSEVVVDGSGKECTFAVDGTQCNSCEFTVSENDPDTTCKTFDCSNVDEVIGTGVVCPYESITERKLEEFLLYESLPCEGGCGLCPEGEKMMGLANKVTLEPDGIMSLTNGGTLLADGGTLSTGTPYFCSQLLLAAGAAFLTDDECTALPAQVIEPCGCARPETSVPSSTPSFVPVVDATTPVQTPADSPVNIGDLASSDSAVNDLVESAARCSGIDKIAAIAAATTTVASMFLWAM